MKVQNHYKTAEVYFSMESPVDGAVSLLNNKWSSNYDVLKSYTLPKCYGGILREDGKLLLKKYIEIKKEGALTDFCKTLINLGLYLLILMPSWQNALLILK